MNVSDWLAIGIPCATILLAAYSAYAGPIAKFVVAKTHNEHLGRIASAMGRYAAVASDELSQLPAGVSLADAKAKIVADMVAQSKVEFAQSIAAIGATDPNLASIAAGELAKIPAKYNLAAIVNNATMQPAGQGSLQLAPSPIPVAVVGDLATASAVSKAAT